MLRKFLLLFIVGKYGGSTIGRGFLIRHGRTKKSVTTPTYKEGSLSGNGILLALVIGALGGFILTGGLSALFIWYAGGDFNLMVNYQMAPAYVCIFIAVFPPTVYLGAIWSQHSNIAMYHATEHKVIQVLSTGSFPTIQLIKEASKTSIRCTTSKLILRAQPVLVLGFILLRWLGMGEGLSFILLLLFAYTACGGYFLWVVTPEAYFEKRPFKYWLTAFGVGFFFPVCMAPFVYEKSYGLKEPSDDILAEGLLAAQEMSWRINEVSES